MIQHHEDRYGSAVGGHREIEAGPIAVEPSQKDIFVEAVVGSGGTVAPLSDQTKGLMWLSEKHADQLQTILDTHRGIEWVQLPWAGVDAFSSVLDQMASRDEADRPVFTSAKGAYSEPVAEHAVTLLQACLREIPMKARAAKWQAARTGLSLFGRHVVIVGAGGIAQALIDLLQPYRCQITVVRREGGTPVAGAGATVGPDQLTRVLASADALVLAAAHTSGTEHLVGRAQFEAMPEHSVLVNIARGPLVDTDALVVALREGQIASAGLDVTDPEPLPDGHPLFDLPQCVITSHSADTPEMTAPLLAARISHNTQAFLQGLPLRGVVVPERGY